MSNITSQMQSRSKPVRVLSSIAAVCVALTGVLGSAAAAGVNIPVWVVIVVGAVGTLIPIGVGEYTKDQVTPWEDVTSKRLPDGTIVAGPAAQARTGSEVQEPVPTNQYDIP